MIAKIGESLLIGIITDASPDFKALKVANEEEVAILARIKNIHVLPLANTNIISCTCVYNHCNTG